MEVSYFSLHNEKLVEVLYKRDHCSCRVDISMLCTRVVANNRYPDTLNTSSFIESNDTEENDNFSDDEFTLYSDKRKLSTSIVENNLSDVKLYVKGSQKINAVLKNIGLVCNSDKMYTMQPYQMFYYKNDITSYSPMRHYISPKQDNNLMHSPDIYNIKDRFFNQIPLKLSPDRNFNNNLVNVQDYCQDQAINSRNSSYINSEKKNYLNNCSKNVSVKYWSMRHMLFSKFDDGIQLDDESFYSVCPEVLSKHIAKRCKNDIAMDPFCGAGGNIIQLALSCKLVIAIDIDPNKIKIAKHNAQIYKVANKIEFVVGDFFTMSSMLKADVICMSPPWGGPEYSMDESFSLESMCKNHYGGGFGIFNVVKKIAPNIAFHMPRTTNIFECLWLAKDLGKVEIQQNIINEKLNSITAFYGEFTDIIDNDY